ncbi:MAG: hypothetical protein A3B25_00740 [Candidatus Ryanbacteria bacterium RIFCSPLOWO2_01_FULL_48_26]|uniref:Uncharacterized protein n=1 Tax=Candidatus Ryanbacteria bacterium RIFCSPLOWO2_01_FULL_48_26 TaxID=1802126 RepID=A0A1G2GWV9_9BACT|nr:MAG: hypothetical protein A3B25_00740 [Candidatus Ryanbacteria bacterium RIFCSPLOWO2_01_FULL_48_26]
MPRDKGHNNNNPPERQYRMKTRKIACWTPVIVATVFLSSGCASVRKKTVHQRVVTGLYDNQLDVLTTNFSRIKERKTTRTELEKMGFTLKNVPNMKVLEGVPAFEELFGKEGFRNLDLEKSVDILRELGLFTLYKIPYKDVTTVSDRIYMNRQKTTVKGPDSMFTIIVRDELVVYSKKNLLFNDTVEQRKRILGGPIDLIGEAGGAVSAGMKAGGL